MPNFYYTDTYGQKHGLFNEEQLKSLVAQGIITPYTPLETEGGHKGLAEQIPGLFDSVLPPFAYVPPITPYIVPVSPVDKIKKLDTYFLVYVICSVIVFPFMLVSSIPITGIGEESAFILLCLSFPLMILSIVFGCMLHYWLWKLIPADIARTTPGKAVGLFFIPFFNFYWVFVSCLGLSTDMNSTLRQRGIQFRVSEGLALVLCICFIIDLVLHLLITVFADITLVSEIICYSIMLTSTIVHILFYKSVKDGAIALLEQEEHSHTRTI